MKQRHSNLELLRIISMCGIIAMHYMGMGGAVQNAVFPDFSWLFNHCVNAFCIPLVNCFVLITGYFLIEKTVFSLRKALDLLVLTAFYGLASYFIWLLIAKESFSLRQMMEALLPFLIGKRWFVETYILLVLFAPFLSALLKNLTQAHYRLLLCVQLAVFSLWYSIGLNSPILDDGYGIINFVTLYLLGGYIRLHGSSSACLNWARSRYLLLYIACALATFILSYFINPYGYAFITNIVGAAALFLYFLKLDLGVKPGINLVSSAAFDVYFVHSDPLTANPLFYHLLQTKLVVNSPWMIPHMFLVIPFVWLLGILICKFRKQLFSATIDRWLDTFHAVNLKIDISQ